MSEHDPEQDARDAGIIPDKPDAGPFFNGEPLQQCNNPACSCREQGMFMEMLSEVSEGQPMTFNFAGSDEVTSALTTEQQARSEAIRDARFALETRREGGPFGTGTGTSQIPPNAADLIRVANFILTGSGV